MHPYPHLYQVAAAATAQGEVELSGADLPPLRSAPPPQFDGPGGLWSPETLLCAAVADCFILTFRSIARAQKLEWVSLACDVEGRLERHDGVTRFTTFTTRARLHVPAGVDVAKAQAALERAEQLCLVSASLNGERHLEAEVLPAAA